MHPRWLPIKHSEYSQCTSQLTLSEVCCTGTAVQEVRAPMVLQNLDCSGGEARLLDCPGVMGDYIDADEYAQVSTFVCDPASATYAVVACGTIPDQGMPPRKPVHIHAYIRCKSSSEFKCARMRHCQSAVPFGQPNDCSALLKHHTAHRHHARAAYYHAACQYKHQPTHRCGETVSSFARVHMASHYSGVSFTASQL